MRDLSILIAFAGEPEMASRTGVLALLCVCELAILDSAIGSNCANTSQPNSSIEVLRFGMPDSTQADVSIWVGIPNRQTSPRMMCISGWGYHVSDGAGVVSAGAEESSHACGGSSEFRLVPSGQTEYWSMTVPRDRLRSPSAVITFSIYMTVTDPSANAAKDEREFRWTGRLQDAIDAGSKWLRESPTKRKNTPASSSR
jgi:hypothetical protein